MRLVVPADAYLPALTTRSTWGEANRRYLALLPRLVPQEAAVRDVYLLLDIPAGVNRRVGLLRDGMLEFVGQVPAAAVPTPAHFLLLYPTAEESPRNPTQPLRSRTWGEVPLTLDLAAARADAVGLDALWAEGQADRFAVLEALSVAPGFYRLARELTARKYHRAAPPLLVPATTEPAVPPLFDESLNAQAVAYAEALRRLRQPPAAEERTIDVRRIPGVEPHQPRIAADGPPPPDDPLAHWVPHDQYYSRFKNLEKSLDFLTLLINWGAFALQYAEQEGRDYRLIQRYERQFCVRVQALATTFGPFVVRDLASTGSDWRFVEGADLTLIIRVFNRNLFALGSAPYILEARQTFGAAFKEERIDYHGVTIESFVSPRREVSLYRAFVGDVVLYSNSPVGIRRVLDARFGRLPSLADAADFQQVRRTYRVGDPAEDSFTYLSAAFLRNLAGPAVKIKEKRRLEALAALTLVEGGALFAAWEAGRLPADADELLRAAGLNAAPLGTPDGGRAFWDGRGRTAVSTVYNTPDFLTPLIELPIDRVTPTEERDYQRYRQGLRDTLGPYYQPLAVRYSIAEKRVAVDAELRGLGASPLYQNLRDVVGGGTVAVDPTETPTVLQATGHLGQAARRWYSSRPSLGDAWLVRFDDGPQYADLVRWYVRNNVSVTAGGLTLPDTLRELSCLPALAGVRVGDRKAFDADLASVLDFGNLFLGPFVVRSRPPYRGAPITRLTLDRRSQAAALLYGTAPPDRRFFPGFYLGHAGDGWYATFSEAVLKGLIDRPPTFGLNPRAPRAANRVPVSAAAVLNLRRPTQFLQALDSYLEWESHRRAINTLPTWYLLYRTGLLAPTAPPRVADETALHFLGFVPVSPETAGFAFDPKRGEVVNRRHGSQRQPYLFSATDPVSPIGRLFDLVRAARLNLRFAGDGVNGSVAVEQTALPRW